jgi:hypothetical protein
MKLAKRGYLGRHPMTNGAYQGAEHLLSTRSGVRGSTSGAISFLTRKRSGSERKARPMLEAVRDGTSKYPQQTLRDVESGLYRIKNADNLIPEAQIDPRRRAHQEHAKAVTTPNVRAHMRMVEMRQVSRALQRGLLAFRRAL